MTQSSYLAIDPGDTSGWATFDEAGEILDFGQIKESEFVAKFTELMHSDLKHVIIEDYKINPHTLRFHANKDTGNLKTKKLIGKLEMLAEMRNVPVTYQRASDYPIGAKWGGIEIPSNHSISHQWVAASHGIFWLQKNGIRKPRIPNGS